MILLAAIDILEGHAVRLARGEFDQRTVYDADPLEAARRWTVQGARALHVVDLDGARAGEPVNLEHVRSICAAVPVPVQVGGGLRSIEALEAAFGAGAWRAVLGTAAYRDLDLLDEALARFGDRIVVSIDARGGRLAASAWSEQTEVDVQAAIEHLGARGVRRFVYSSIERDGMLAGPDLDGVARVAGAVRGSFVYSGGIGTLEDLRALAALRQVNLSGVIVGRALYERRFDIDEAQRALDGGR
jgi:phosphoribosylformimino-5-aminoimidazole carboxamide ribotide isomerase